MLQVSAATRSSSLSLQKAILVYGSKERTHYELRPTVAHATVHDVGLSTGAPVIQAGRLMTQSDLKTLVEGLTESQSLALPTWLEPTMLAVGAGRMLWYTPACKRAMFFKVSSFTKNSFERHALVPNPALVWMVMQGSLYVYAIKGDARPTKETALYQAPFFNVWSEGKVCVGSANMPQGDDQSLPEKWQAGFFGSHFTHPNFTEKDRLIKGGCPINFWKKMVANPSDVFPETKLVKVNVTVGDLLCVEVREKLSSMSKAKGQF